MAYPTTRLELRWAIRSLKVVPLTSTPSANDDRRRLTAVELFCGAGGMGLGFEQAGFDLLAAIDLDPLHLAAHEYNFPLCEPVCADVSAIGGDRILEAAQQGWSRRHPGMSFPGKIDCVFGGPSCQGFSVIGARKRDDPRNALVAQFARIVTELRPRWFVMENVPGLVSPGYRQVLDAFYRTLRAAGYQVAEPWKLNARHHGVPQERKRIFVVGADGDEQVPSAPQPRRDTPTVAEAIGDLAMLGRFRTLREQDALALNTDQRVAMESRQSLYVRRINGSDYDPSRLADARESDGRVLTSVGLATHSEAVVARFRRLRRGRRDKIGRLPKLDPHGQAPTLRAGTGRDHGSFTSARPVHYSSLRVITVREAARLHGFPDSFGFHATKWHGFRQVGNAVPPPLACAVAEMVVRVADARPIRRSGAPLPLGPSALLRMTMREAAEYYEIDPAALPANVRSTAARRGVDAA